MPISDFIFNGDRPIDQVIYLKTGSFTIPGGGSLGLPSTTAHSLGFKPLMVVNWSLDSNFSTTKECNLPVFEGTDPYAITVNNKASATNLVISGLNPTASDVVVYWRAYGFMPSNVDVDANPTASLADDFVFNGDYNYCKLMTGGDLYVPATALETITHALGYRPQIMAWSDDGTYTAQLNTFGEIKVGVNTITITSPVKGVHLRVYEDEQVW